VKYHLQMLNPLAKFTAPLVLLIALFFLTGIASAATTLSAEATDICGQTAGEQQAPSTDTDCAEHDCGGYCCNVSILTSNLFSLSCPQEFLVSRPILISILTEDYILSIDYPP